MVRIHMCINQGLTLDLFVCKPRLVCGSLCVCKPNLALAFSLQTMVFKHCEIKFYVSISQAVVVEV